MIRERSTEDKRVVRVRLTDKGKSAYYHHESFHRQMIENVKGELTEQETTILIYALAKMVDYFQFIYYDTDEESEYVDWKKIKEENK